MAIPNYTYLKLKMPDPKGVINVKGSFKEAYYCEQDYVAQVAALIAPYALDSLDRDTRRAPVKEAAKEAVVLGQPSIDEAAMVPATVMARLAPPSRRSPP
jgi:hypothetical protein